MHNLLLFIRKHWFVVLFLFLETISVAMVFNSYSYHHSLAFKTINEVTGTVFSTYTNLSDYFTLKETNDNLTAENASLLNQLQSSFLTTDTGFAYRDTLYRYITAHVVSISVNHASNYMMLNKGSLHGVKKEMGVISNKGVAGIIVGVSKNYSLAMLLLHQNAKISGRIKKDNQLVSIVWDGDDYHFGMIEDIPSHVQLYQGDTIVTSGNSLIFPQGIVVGTVNEVESNPNLNFKKGTLLFATDFGTLHDVYIIDNLMKNQQEKLLKQENE